MSDEAQDTTESQEAQKPRSKESILHEELAGFLKQAVSGSVIDRSMDVLPSVEVDASSIASVLRALKEGEYTADFLDSINGCDMMGYNGENNPERRFLIVYQLFSYTKKQYYFIKVYLPESSPKIPTVDTLYGNANWLEREIFDLLGIEFTGSRDLRRLLLPEDWEGYPLRKDYKEQLLYDGMMTTRHNPLDDFKKRTAELLEG